MGEVSPRQGTVESVKAVNVITTANVWIEELREDADYGPIITKWVPVECSLPFMCEDDANKLDRVLKGLPTNIAAIKFDSVYRVAQLVQIWPREDLPERAKLMEMAKQQDISAEALEVSRELLAFPV
ncbi:unnamed protein product [Heligmosomoides polygyrus]|uniref:DUF2384 domain-containing protein n=1 Tax=Heligmosomoides polygyrus TaxID=6339 RepID=A0A183G9H4_HELPZ|nr:unnamed protein product [Heligmosomoides polygyrus]